MSHHTSASILHSLSSYMWSGDLNSSAQACCEKTLYALSHLTHILHPLCLKVQPSLEHPLFSRLSWNLYNFCLRPLSVKILNPHYHTLPLYPFNSTLDFPAFQVSCLWVDEWLHNCLPSVLHLLPCSSEVFPSHSWHVHAKHTCQYLRKIIRAPRTHAKPSVQLTSRCR